MTLITYPTRVHFADDVLQEALQSELESIRCQAPLIVFENHLVESEFLFRVMEGMPRKTEPTSLSFAKSSNLSAVAKGVVGDELNPDVVIAFGSARAIELGRKCRYALTQKFKKRPSLFAIPGIDGLPGPCTRNMETWRSGLPTVLIFDPTVTLNAEPAQSWRSTTLSLVRCIESYLATAYNPPADGMALDALSRCVANFPRIGPEPKLELQRELMAAGLNASLSQEKGVGPTLTLAAALANQGDALDEADLAGVILPSVIKRQAMDQNKVDVLMKVVGGPEVSLDAALGRLIGNAPMPKTLSALGLSQDSIEVAAQSVNGKADLDYQSARQILDPVF